MATVERFEDLLIWQLARGLVRGIYAATDRPAWRRDPALRDQCRRAAIAAMTHMAEGFGRHTDHDFAHFLDIARGSLLEVQSLLYVALDLDYLDAPTFLNLYDRSRETTHRTSALAAYLRGKRSEVDGPRSEVSQE